jgi:hypothetical protein
MELYFNLMYYLFLLKKYTGYPRNGGLHGRAHFFLLASSPLAPPLAPSSSSL